MKILAYDTSSDVLSIAYFDGKKKTAEFESQSFARHSSVLAPSLERLLKDNHVSLRDIEVLAVGLGPGSFTGLRVGIATAKIFGYICPMKLVGVSSLEAIAWEGAGFGGEIAVILDAKKDKLYSGVFRIKDQALKIIQKPRLIKIETLIKGLKIPRLFLGDGAVIYYEKIMSAKYCQIHEKARVVYPKAANILRQAMTKIQKKEFMDPFSIEPLYLHPRDCNVSKPLTYLPAGRQARAKR